MRASASETEAKSHADGTVGCPLCSVDANSERDIYSHLLVSHRNSVLASALLETDALPE